MSRRPAPFPAAPSPDALSCDQVSEALMLRLDREHVPLADEALEAHLDAHLAACPRCRQRSREMVGVARALKHWDAEVSSRIQPPSRLTLEILGAVRETGRRRREESRALFLSRFAMAASILVVLSTAAFAAARGARDGRRTAERAGNIARVVHESPANRPLPSFEVPHVALAPSAPLSFQVSPFERLGAPVDVALGASVMAGEDLAHLQSVLTRLEIARRDQAAFQAEFGDPGIAFQDPRTGRYRWASVEGLAYIQDRHGGAGSIEGWVEGLRLRGNGTPGSAHVYAYQGQEDDTGRHVTDVVRVTPVDPMGGAAGSTGREEIGPEWKLGNGLFLKGLLLGGQGYAPQGGQDVLDLSTALARGRVVLHEGADDDLVLVARGLKEPLYVPAGELVAGGSVDRVVARSIWIPASKRGRAGAEEKFVLSCRPISSPHTAAPLRAVGLVAGPDLRRLLQVGADRDDVLAFVLERAPAGMHYSLLAYYDSPDIRQTVSMNASVLRRYGVRAFVVTNGRGELEGYEMSLLPREAAAKLLGRLWVGYSIEEATRLRGAQDAPTAVEAPAAVEAERTFERLLRYPGTFHARRGRGGAVRTARLHDPLSDVLVVSVEERDSGARPIHASALP